MRALLVALSLALSATPALADSRLPAARLADRQLPDPGQEQRARALMGELRCMVCDGQSIADSDAELAGDMRAMVRARVAAGEPPEAVRAWLVARYGPSISYRPRFGGALLLLWLAPLLLLAGGALIAARRFRRVSSASGRRASPRRSKASSP